MSNIHDMPNKGLQSVVSFQSRVHCTLGIYTTQHINTKSDSRRLQLTSLHYMLRNAIAKDTEEAIRLHHKLDEKHLPILLVVHKTTRQPSEHRQLDAIQRLSIPPSTEN